MRGACDLHPGGITSTSGSLCSGQLQSLATPRPLLKAAGRAVRSRVGHPKCLWSLRAWRQASREHWSFPTPIPLWSVRSGAERRRLAAELFDDGSERLRIDALLAQREQDRERLLVEPGLESL